MVRDVRIKEFRFSETISATTTGSFLADHVINGEILEVDWTYGSQGTGSLFLTTTTGEEFWRRDTASGTVTRFAYPRVLSEGTTGSADGGILVPFVVNTPIVLNVKAALSGTTPLSVNVRYR